MNDKGAKPEAKPVEGAPEKYSDFTLPEGFEADPTMMGEAQGIFKDLGLSQAAAQRLVDFYAKQARDAAEAPVNFWKETQQRWVDEIKADPEIGGKLDVVKTTVGRMLDSVLGATDGAKFREAMDYTGAGNNPTFVRAFYKIAGLLTEGGHVKGANPAPGGQGQTGQRPASLGQALYPNLGQG